MYKQKFLKKDYPGYKLSFADGFFLGCIFILTIWTLSQNLAASRLYINN